MKFISLMATLTVAAPSYAAPIYLECEVKLDGGLMRHFAVSLNESEETAGFTMIESGWSVQKRPAQFSPNEVTWSFPGTVSTRTISIDRSTLEFMSSQRGISDTDWHGQCTIPKDNPSKKF